MNALSYQDIVQSQQVAEGSAASLTRLWDGLVDVATRLGGAVVDYKAAELELELAQEYRLAESAAAQAARPVSTTAPTSPSSWQTAPAGGVLGGINPTYLIIGLVALALFLRK